MFSNTNNRKKTQRSALLVTAAILSITMVAGNTYAADNNRSHRQGQRHQNNDHARRNNDRHNSHGRQNNNRNHNRRHNNNRNKSKGIFDLFFSIGNYGQHNSPRYNYESSNHAHGGKCYGGYYQQVWVAPVYQARYDSCGNTTNVLVRNGYYNQVWQPRVCTINGHHHPSRNHRTSGITIGGHYRR